MEQWKKRISWVIVVLILLFMIGVLLYKTGILCSFQLFFGDYVTYVNNDIEHRAELFESIIGGLCAGVVTFGALFITILHENRKNRIFWERERQKEKEERLLAVRPFLNIEIKSVSAVRNENCDKEKDFIIIGAGEKYQYAHIVLSNHGYGKCKKVMLGGLECSINQLDVNEECELDVYFKGLKNSTSDTEFTMFVEYQDIFGNAYLQRFSCKLRSGIRNLKIEIEEPLLKKGER